MHSMGQTSLFSGMSIAGKGRALSLSSSSDPIDQKLELNDDFKYGLVYSPVVFIPGDGGSQLEAKLNKPDRVSYLCDLKADWFDIWLNIHLLTPVTFSCLIDNLRLVYNATTRMSYNSPGVEIRPTKFGSLESVDYLDTVPIPMTDYFDNIISALEKRSGLTRNVDMVGAAYDFRKAPNELDIFFKNLTYLIEVQYIKNNYKPVTLICHSMGCLNSLYLLNRQTEGWRHVYIRRLISLGAPWDGSFKALSAMLFGDNLGISFLDKQKLQTLQFSWPSLMYLLPKDPTFAQDRVLVQAPNVNYTLNNLDELFNAAGMIDQREMWHDTRAITEKLQAPDVELWCLYGSGIDTPSKITFKEPISPQNFNGSKKNPYEELQSDGDGTVNLESLRACERFAKMQTKPVYTRQFDTTDHIDILRHKDVANFIVNNIMNADS